MQRPAGGCASTPMCHSGLHRLVCRCYPVSSNATSRNQVDLVLTDTVIDLMAEKTRGCRHPRRSAPRITARWRASSARARWSSLRQRPAISEANGHTAKRPPISISHNMLRLLVSLKQIDGWPFRRRQGQHRHASRHHGNTLVSDGEAMRDASWPPALGLARLARLSCRGRYRGGSARGRLLEDFNPGDLEVRSMPSLSATAGLAGAGAGLSRLTSSTMCGCMLRSRRLSPPDRPAARRHRACRPCARRWPSPSAGGFGRERRNSRSQPVRRELGLRNPDRATAFPARRHSANWS